MTYIELINHFWEKDLEHNFTDKDVSLYFYLLNVCNRLTWKNPFGQSNAMMAAKFGWGKRAFDSAKKKLKDAGLINFKAGDGRGNVYQYEIVGLIKVHEKGTQKHTPSTHLSDTLSAHLSAPKRETSIDLNKTKTKIPPPTPLPDLHPAANKNHSSARNAFPQKSEKVEMPLKTEKENRGDIIDHIVNLFAQTHGNYEILNPGKERAAAGKLLALYRKKHPGATTTETLEAIEHYFKRCMQIPDAWMQNNMSLTLIISKFNEINKHLKNGSNKHHSHGATADELANLFTKKLFGNQHL